jgi:hypothetical protein
MKHGCIIAAAFAIPFLPGCCPSRRDIGPPPSGPTVLAAVSSEGKLPIHRTYEVRQTVDLREIPAGAKKVKMWICLPDDAPHQKLIDLSVKSAPSPWRLIREGGQGNRFLYVEADDPRSETLSVVVDFTARRPAPSEEPLLPRSRSFRGAAHSGSRHSRMPPEAPGRSFASTRSAFARTGLNRTSLNLFGSIPKAAAPSTGFQSPPSL